MSSLPLDRLVSLLCPASGEEADAGARIADALAARRISTVNDLLLLLCQDDSIDYAASSSELGLDPAAFARFAQRFVSFLAADGQPADRAHLRLQHGQHDGTGSASTATETSKLTSDTFKTGCAALDETAIVNILPGEIVEIVGRQAAGKTFLSLQIVLRHLHSHPRDFALWLDTESTFSAETAQRILEGLSISPTSPHSTSALDRLIVSQALDLPSAIQAIQQVKRAGFPGHGTNVTDDQESDEDTKFRTSRSPDVPVDSRTALPPERGPAAVPEDLSGRDEDTLMRDAMDTSGPNAASLLISEVKAETKEQAKDAVDFQLRFVVIDSITPLIRNLLSAVTAEGHARMVSFMRFLRSTAIAGRMGVLLTNTLTSNTSTPTPIRQDVLGNALSVFPTSEAQGVKPSLGPTFTFLSDTTLAVHFPHECFPGEARTASSRADPSEADTSKRIVEIWRSRSGPARRWTVTEVKGASWV